MDIRNLLRQSYLFAGVSDGDLDRLAEISRLRTARRGEVLFADGDEAEGFFIVASGKVKIYKLSPEGKERILHIIHPGWSFAEAAIFGDGRYPAYAEPLATSELLFLPRTAFLDLLARHNQLALNMIGGLSRFLRQFVTQIEELTFKDVPARLARYLLDLACSADHVELPISKTQLASNLGTVSETLSRTFRRLSDEGLIRVAGKRIDILDREGLIMLSRTCKE
ncbi:Crp/Fnr family transcriptional regulator [Geothermobacter ehrlichii]|uniref:Crp/Fnr family transcriptional regulator n=1 Tax=Geothermobacter ehrlichii TaxID=213224 RepID=A0A5D3WMJ4_9BACT|nr:Crp/Fnr family transcriptional regulator [Geothermobacter ehrlichii]TYO99653.1 Crp/Fnr family transcriptional regulator [Geothermobacter ehrlichii]